MSSKSPCPSCEELKEVRSQLCRACRAKVDERARTEVKASKYNDCACGRLKRRDAKQCYVCHIAVLKTRAKMAADEKNRRVSPTVSRSFTYKDTLPPKGEVCRAGKAHYWKLETPNGKLTSSGRCIYCKAEREFPNWHEDATYQYRLSETREHENVMVT